jgi:predicted ATP-grasp superfamily ATP-dependent carboligase
MADNTEVTSVPALVFGVGVTALAAVRSLGRSGIPTYFVTDDPGVIAHSRWFRRPPESAGTCHDPSDLPRYLGTLPFERAVLMPCSDGWTRAVAGLEASLAERFPASVARAEVLDALVDKGNFARLLDDAGVPHPRTVRADSVEALERLPDAAFESAFLKPCDSERFLARYGVKAFWVSDRAAAMRLASEAIRDGCAVLLQEYLPGSSAAHYFVDGFVDRHGQVCGLFVRRRLRMYPPDFGNSAYAVSVPLEEAAGAVDSILKLFARVGYRGIFDAEFMRDPRDGQFKLLEVNARPWWHMGFAARCGVDVARMAYQDALEMPVEPARGYRIGVRCIYPYFDYLAFRELHRRGELGFWTWLLSALSAQQLIFWWRDPMPGVAEYVGILGRLARRWLRARWPRPPQSRA